MSKRKRWVCPQCGVGKLGLQRPRKNDIIRYCFPCSTEAGVLVERVCPADISKKKKKAEALARKKAQTASKPKKPRTTKRSWIKNTRYEFTLFEGQPDEFTFNMMRLAERMCHSKGWKEPYRILSLWSSTMAAKGGPNHPYLDNTYSGGIRISKTRSGS